MKALTILFLAVSINVIGSDAEHFRSLVEKNCVQCHGPEKQKGDIRLDTLPLSNLTLEDLETWQLALDQVVEFDMPPDDDLALSDQQITAFESYLSPLINGGLAHLSSEEVILRRLNKEQYKNTVRDLFGINVEVEDPASSLPPDEVAEGFDNVGSALSISDLHLDAYLAAAEDVVSRWEALAEATPNSFQLQVPTPSTENKITFSNGTIQTETHIDLLHSAWTNRRFKTLTFPAKENGNRLLPHDGTYRITVDAETINTDNPEGYELIKKMKLFWEPTPDEKPRFGFFLRRPLRSITPNIDHRVATFELDHNERKTMSLETWLPGGQYTLAVNFDTGPRMDIHQASAMFHLLREKDTVDSQEFKDMTAKVRKDRDFRPVAQAYLASLPFPRVRFHSIKIEGPLEDSSAPTKEYITSLDSDTTIRNRELESFARKAFRRPVSDEELKPYFAYAEENGYRGAVKAMLCSPHFLYLHEKPGKLDDHALANRLAYFLWNTMPDDELFTLASQGKLRDSSTLKAQLARMLADSKAASFFDRFTYQWLGFDNMDDMPASKEFTFYHDFFVRDLMKQETSVFFENLLKSNAPVSDLVHADYTFMNGPLARHYGINSVNGGEFEKVSLAEMPRRRGLLGQGAVLTTSANGIDTSPVIRGIWVLEHLLGTPPSPPPPEVEVLEPDTRGTKTLKEMYAVHRSDASCNRCHEDIDPLGFALENFDPIGRWRDEYEGGLEVDSTGQMPDGQTFEDIEGLRSLLKGDAIDLIAENLLRRLMVCATGRELSVADDAEIDSILAASKPTGYRANDLLFSVLTSDAFLNK